MSYPRRKQDETLFFVTKQTTASNTKEWLLPKDVIYKGETIKQGLKRILSCNCGDNFIAFIYGNSPVGFSTHYSDRYEEQKNICDHNIFYFLARYISGHVRDNTEYQWLNIQELEQILPKSTYTQLSYVFQISQ
ncbi:PREDICTED: uncharacterized protein LOC105366818 [Ceratosolen solmsi marchali]|uniref:Uncharacterized protein LOC105366818 n=1 Tax=Ceratosolen solmsi marchali TaxID=326594 RepID=A0AAJ7E0Z2_9HYME|nr:PREDICTED: uncharacterized protein LOC105366818 [Ceratosolen solmsi marchali]